MSDYVSRPYVPDDFAACVAIFDSNVPSFFAPAERAEFCGFLEEAPSYLVLTRKEAVVACGGLSAGDAPRQVALAWGMVDRALHRQGLGTRLTQARLALARAMPEVNEVTLSTSQHTAGFYAGFGFRVMKITPDGFGPGLDRVDMALRLDG